MFALKCDKQEFKWPNSDYLFIYYFLRGTDGILEDI